MESLWLSPDKKVPVGCSLKCFESIATGFPDRWHRRGEERTGGHPLRAIIK
jgi:hypothetical protein